MTDSTQKAPAREIEFPSDTAHRKRWFKGCSFSHPAKMHLSLQIYLIEHYTKVGDTILDPMTGSGTVLVACAIGRNVICVELEGKFVKMQCDNWEKIQRLGPMLGYAMGQAVILQGDARQLNNLLADCAIFSPTYGNNPGTPSLGSVNKDSWGKEGKDIVARRGLEKGYSKSNNNIGNLPYGEISAVISSPPYEGIITGKELPESEKLIERKSGKEKWGKHLRLGKSQLTKYADAVITSPPYEHQMHKNSDIGKVEQIKAINPSHYVEHSQPVIAARYNPSDENIGNLKSDSYLQAMLQVYQNCHRVLKEKGLMVLVVKNFIRDKKIVQLDLDTIKLCEQAGFTLIERLKRKLTQQSFWRRIYQQKYPDAPKIEFEDILVFQRSK